MKELIADVGPGSVADGDIFLLTVSSRSISRCTSVSAAITRCVRKREDGAAQDKTGDDDRGEIVNEPVKQIGGGMPPPFLLDEAVRLKNKISQ